MKTSVAQATFPQHSEQYRKEMYQICQGLLGRVVVDGNGNKGMVKRVWHDREAVWLENEYPDSAVKIEAMT